MVLEDFGDQSLEQIIRLDHANLREASYRHALDQLIVLQAQPMPTGLPILLEQIELFWTWFCQRHLQSEWDVTYRSELQPIFEHLVREISNYPKCLTHMDYHCRNLMVRSDQGALGILDFQDAAWGPVLYDLVSLLEDAYWVCPNPQKKQYFNHYRQALSTQQPFLNWTESDWQRCFSLIALQRHLKNLGIFSRLHYRDHKSQYLQYLPRLIRYILDHADRQPDFQSLSVFFKTHWVPLLAKQMGTDIACLIEP
jgi:aminoglycoside/choline kinase family phosphotransferase